MDTLFQISSLLSVSENRLQKTYVIIAQAEPACNAYGLIGGKGQGVRLDNNASIRKKPRLNHPERGFSIQVQAADR